jgi:hypothetical protein
MRRLLSAMHKRGMFFSLQMVAIVMAMVGMVSMIYFTEQDDIAASVVSPIEVLEMRDRLVMFEAEELRLVEESLERASGSFGDEEFLVSFRENLLDGLSDEMRDFLVRDLYLNGQSMGELGDLARSSFIENVVYSKIFYEGDELVLVRGDVGKAGTLRAGKLEDINFQVDYVFEFGREYRVGDDFVVRVV